MREEKCLMKMKAFIADCSFCDAKSESAVMFIVPRLFKCVKIHIA